MKTQNSNQETGKSQINKLTIRASVVLLVAVMVSASVNAQDLWEQLSNPVSYGKMTLTLDEQPAETKSADIAIDAIQSELNDQLSFFNELTIPAEADEPMNVENWMTNDRYFNETMEYTSAGTIEFINEESEEAMEVENWMTNEEFFHNAGQASATSTDHELVKYAEKILNTVENEENLAIESWMTDTNYFIETEQVIADKITISVETEDRMAIESWMLEPEHFSNQLHYDHLAVN